MPELEGEMLQIAKASYLQMGARHQFPAISATVDDTFNEYTPRLFDLVIEAAKIAHSHDLSELAPRNGPEKQPFYKIWPGEHYRLLYGICKYLKPSLVIEIGTATGMSAASMLSGLPKESKLVTFDLVRWSDYGGNWLNQSDFDSGRISQETDDLKDAENFAKHSKLFEQADFIFIDGPKDIVFEKAVLGYLRAQSVNKSRIVMFDDIKGPFVNVFWRNIDLPKFDASSFGSWNGTGLLELPAA